MSRWGEAAHASLGMFWSAFWAFGLGYLISSMIQVFVTRARMRAAMGDPGPKSVALGAGFGFLSSSCSFAALSTTRALFVKGAGLIPALAFLLASTNLVIELGIVIAVFLTWQFVVGEYVGGLLLIGLMWGLVKLTRPDELVEQARERAESESEADADEDQQAPDWRELMTSKRGWREVAQTYLMEWQMVWKDVSIGFTVAGVIAAFVPPAAFTHMFVGSDASDPSFWQLLVQTLVGPLAAFVTFIGSMGNIPLAAVLFGSGVSFAGVMAFIFSDLVVLPVLRIQARYYGWRFALYVAGVFLAALVITSLAMHYGFAALDLLPSGAQATRVVERSFFAIDHSFVLGLLFVVVSAGAIAWVRAGDDEGDHDDHDHDHDDSPSIASRVLLGLSILSYAWLAVGIVLYFLASNQG